MLIKILFFQLKLIADFFVSQLIRSRHPGAFELTASGFQSFCEILLRCAPHPCLAFLQLDRRFISYLEYRSTKMSANGRSSG